MASSTSRQGSVHWQSAVLEEDPAWDISAVPVYTGTDKFAVVIRNLLSAEECKAMVDRAEASGFESLAAIYNPSYRNNDRVMIHDEVWTNGLASRLADHVPITIGTMAWTGRCNPRLRVCRYAPGGKFAPHTDGDYRESATTRSLLTVNIYLNDVHPSQGGATTFLAADGKRLQMVQPEAGNALVFEHDILHQGDTCAAPTKYLCRSDVIYGKMA